MKQDRENILGGDPFSDDNDWRSLEGIGESPQPRSRR